MLKGAFDAPGEALAYSVSFADANASWRGYRGVFWLNIDYWNAPLEGFVLDKELEFSEGPAVEASVLAFPVFSAIPYPRQPFHHDYAAFFQTIHESPADLMQDSVDVPPLSSTPPFQPASCRLRAFALGRGAEPYKTVSLSENFPSFNSEAVRGDEEVLQADINANRVVTFRLWDFAYCDVEKESFSPVNQKSMCRLDVFKRLSLVFSGIHPCLAEP